MIKVRFLLSPSFSPWLLAYSAGQVAELPAAQAQALVSAGIAEYTGVKEADTREKAVKENREKR